MRGVVSSPEYVVAAANAQPLVTAPGQFAVVFAAEPFVAKAAGPSALTEVLVRYEPGADRDPLDERLDVLGAARRRHCASRAPSSRRTPWCRRTRRARRGVHVRTGLLLVLAIVVGGLALGARSSRGAPRRHVLLGGLVAADLGIVVGVVAAVLLAGTITDAVDIPVTDVAISIGGIVVAGVLGSIAVLLAIGVARVAGATCHPRGVGMALAGTAAALAVAAVVASLGIVDAAQATLAKAARIEIIDAQIAVRDAGRRRAARAADRGEGRRGGGARPVGGRAARGR